MIKANLFLVVALLILFGCQRETESVYELTDITYMQNNEWFNCQGCFSIGQINLHSGFVIRDENTYRMYEDSMKIYPISDPPVDCDTATLVSINFNEYTLLGMATSHGACDTLTRKIWKDEVNNKIVYDIDIKEYTGGCVLILYMPLNLVLIPKIPDDYFVEFTVTRHQ